MRLILLCGLAALGLTAQAWAQPRALVVRETIPDGKLAEEVAQQIAAAGYETQTVEPDVLTSALASPPDLLVITESSHLPTSAEKAVESYIDGGGNVMALRAPLWQSPMIKYRGKWLSADQYQKATTAVPPPHVLLDFKTGSTKGWTRATDNSQSATTWVDGEPGPAAGMRSLHVKISNLTSWDTYGTTGFKSPFPKGHTLTVLTARGGPRTTQLAVEWDEKDGSRWIATVPLDRTWRRYVLKPADFRFFVSTPNRGGRGDVFQPENAAAISFGLAFTHTGSEGGDHEYWVGPLGTAEGPALEDGLSATPEVKPADLLTPAYKFFECTGVAGVTTDSGAKLMAGGQILSPQPRPEGRGFGKGRDWRFIPLATARTAKGEWRGTPAAMMIHSEKSPNKGGVWAAFGFQDPVAYADPNMLSLIRQAAERTNHGLYLLEGGTEFFTYPDTENIRVGAQVINASAAKVEGLRISWELKEALTGKIVFSSEKPADVEAKQSAVVSDNVTLGPKPGSYEWPEDGLIATTRLTRDGRVIDEISHEVNLWQPKPLKHFVKTDGGRFVLDGKPWKAHGVNYMPSSGIGTEDGEYFEYWIGARSYDPVIVERDLEHIKDIGLNAISAFIYDGSAKDGNLLDLLHRCDKLGLKVNLSLRPGTPMDFEWNRIRSIIDHYKLWDNDTVFAYDLAWEPMFPDHNGRKRWDTQWETWITERYGSLESAEKDWGSPAPKEDGKLSNPPDAQLVSDGEHRKMVAAYRRFLDDLLYENYSRARALVKSVDPNHLVSFRMADGGNPTYNWDRALPYDFAGVAPTVDFLSPEAYGRISDQWDKVKEGWFERQYARWAAPEDPMIWAEMGMSVWDNAWMTDRPEKLRYQADYFALFYRMLISSGADGVFYWWYPGGFRTGENSDFGIINPDGSDRLVTAVIRENSRKFLDAPYPSQPDVWLEMDRDADARGIFGIHEALKDRFWKAIDEGKTPGLKTAGTGTTSADCPMVSIGGTACAGTTPPRYLNAAFDKLLVRDYSGQWVEAADGSEIAVDPTQPVIARVVVRNLGEAKWVAGSVEAVCGGETCSLAADVAPHATVELQEIKLASAVSAPVTVQAYMRARGSVKYGQVASLKLVPKK